jgi:glycosyltransferase involved in cell wall biosynthesis
VRVHQITANLSYGDAVTNHVVEIDARLKAWGLDARIYAQTTEPRMRNIGRPESEYQPFLSEGRDLLIYHYAIYSTTLQLYMESRNRKLVIYHNITPPEYFRGYDRNLETACRFGRLALPDLRGCDVALADSDYNRRELVAAGIPDERTDVLPIFLNLEDLAASPPNKALGRKLRGNGKTNLLFVGRVVPNKAHEDLIKILYFYHRYVDRQVHLWLVGPATLPVYRKRLAKLVSRLGLDEAVTFTGRVSLRDLRTYYESADLFLCASRHEGFGVPLAESMHFRLPILAYNATAVPETLGQAGVLFNHLQHAEIAEMVNLMVSDPILRQQIVRAQRQRLTDLSPERVESKLQQILERVGVL